jgi:hypothetical protein
VQDGIYPVDSLPVNGFHWQYKTIGIDTQWEDKQSCFDSDFVAFMEKELILMRSTPGAVVNVSRENP